MQINLSDPNYSGVSDACVLETGRIISQCNQYAQEALIYGIIIGMLVGAACMLIAIWWYRGRKN